jgi:hypothetical protein
LEKASKTYIGDDLHSFCSLLTKRPWDSHRIVPESLVNIAHLPPGSNSAQRAQMSALQRITDSSSDIAPCPMMGWTGCFPRGDSLQRLRRSNPEKQPMDTITSPLASIGIDIGKEVFHIVGYGTDGKIAFRRKIKRLALAETFKQLRPCVVGMEASRTLSAGPCVNWAKSRGLSRRST